MHFCKNQISKFNYEKEHKMQQKEDCFTSSEVDPEQVKQDESHFRHLWMF